jgi:hypothetical protein
MASPSLPAVPLAGGPITVSGGLVAPDSGVPKRLQVQGSDPSAETVDGAKKPQRLQLKETKNKKQPTTSTLQDETGGPNPLNDFVF